MPGPTRPIIFGIYPGGAAGGDTGLLAGPPDDLERVNACLDALQGQTKGFVVRCYDSFQDPDSPHLHHPTAPGNYRAYASAPRRPLELVLQFRSASGDVAGYLDFVRARIEQHATNLYAVQITEESNFTDGPDVIDGAYGEVLRALVEGVVVAKASLRSLGREHVKVGFSVTPTFGPAAEYWSRLREASSERFVESIDYVGLDFFPDTFYPVASDQLASTVTTVLQTLRREWMPVARLSDRVAIAITEHGWPTGPDRSFERQAQVLATVISTIAEVSSEFNIDRYSLYSLRDVDASTSTTENNFFNFFGITTADYHPKPAFDVYRDLIRRYGAELTT